MLVATTRVAASAMVRGVRDDSVKD